MAETSPHSPNWDMENLRDMDKIHPLPSEANKARWQKTAAPWALGLLHLCTNQLVPVLLLGVRAIGEVLVTRPLLQPLADFQGLWHSRPACKTACSSGWGYPSTRRACPKGRGRVRTSVGLVLGGQEPTVQHHWAGALWVILFWAYGGSLLLSEWLKKKKNQS